MNLEVDLLYFETTSTYFEVEEPDDLRRQGHSGPGGGATGAGAGTFVLRGR